MTRWVIAALVAFALLRGVVGALSFPFFGQMDEVSHVDTVFKYARGQWPEAGRDSFDRETIELFLFVSSPEFKQAPGPAGVSELPAQFDWPGDTRRQHLEHMLEQFGDPPNHEAFETPPYYAIAGAWLNLGRAFGLTGLDSLYWLRLLGALALAGGVLCSHLFLRAVAPARRFVWLGVPALVAAYPQDVFYFVNNDVLNVMSFPLCLLLVERVARGRGRLATVLATGALVGLTVLGKGTNLPLAVAVIALCVPPLRARDRNAGRRFVTLAIGAALPYVGWHLYSLIATGHLTGTTHKTAILGVTRQSWEGILAHPMIGFTGLCTFFDELIARFWRGEILWHGVMMQHTVIDRALLTMTIVFPAIALIGGIRRSTLRRDIAIGAWLAIALGIVMMAALSLVFDFGANVYPSRDFPYFVSGRLQSGLFVFVGALLLDGVERSVGRIGRFGPSAAWTVLILTASAMSLSEIMLMTPVVASPHNFWHL